MSRQPVPVTIPQGIVRMPTKNSKSSNWRDGHLIRWSDGKLMPVGGWEKQSYTAFASKCRKIHKWTTLTGLSITAYLCEGHVYVDNGDGVLLNISPTVALVQPFSSLVAGGYGDYLYGYGGYGTPRPNRDDSSKLVTPGYYMDNWGQNLVVMTGADGRLLMWDPSTPATPLTAVTGAPTGNRAFVVMPQNHVILFGAGGTMNRYAWCDEEDITDWNFASTASKAGEQFIQPASPIISASRSGDEAVFFTENGMAYYIEFVGMPYIFGGDSFGSGCTPRSPMSIADTPVGAVWFAENGVWAYQSRAPVSVACDVWNHITDDIDDTYARVNSVLIVNSSFAELWWFYPVNGEQSNSRYVIWNFKEKWWSLGKMNRLAGINATYTGYPVMSDGNDVFLHEKGDIYTNDVELPWAETFPLTMNYGATLATFTEILPDYDGDINAISFQLKFNISRSQSDDTYILESDTSFIQEDGSARFRDTGRDFRILVQQTANGVGSWTLGDNAVVLIPRGSR